MRLAALAAVLALLAPAHAASDWTLRQLFDALSRERPDRATFQERKYLALLDRPVESSGELVFIAPARLEKRTLVPRAESVVVDGNRLTLERNGKRHTLALGEQPAIAVLVESIRATLAGDLAGLTRTYSVGLDGAREGWRLVLRPLDPAVSPLVERIEIAGARGAVRTVEVFQADGDRSVMTIAPLR